MAATAIFKHPTGIAAGIQALRNFKDVKEFMDELKGLLDGKAPQAPGRTGR